MMDFTDARFDEVLRALAAVPRSNSKERADADMLTNQILEARRSKRTRQAALEAAPEPKRVAPSPSAKATNDTTDVWRCERDCEYRANDHLEACGCEPAFGGSAVADENNTIVTKCASIGCVPTVNQNLKACREWCRDPRKKKQNRR